MCKAVRDLVVEEQGTFDLVLANGVVHHLNDQEAADLFRYAHAALKPGGRLVTHDGCFVPGQSRLARYLLRKDRGEYVRVREGYVNLASRVFPHVQVSVRHNLLRLPYTHIILECSSQAPAAGSPTP